MSGRIVNTNKFWCISFAANRERFSFLFVFFFVCFFPFSDWVFVIELLIQVYGLKYFLPIYPSLSTSFIISLLLSTSIIISLLLSTSFIISLLLSTSFIIISLLLSTSFIFSLSYYYFFDAALLVCVCCNSYFVVLGQICFSHFFSPFSQTNYYSRQEISTNLPVKIVM